MRPEFPLTLYWNLGVVLRDLKHVDSEFLRTFDVGPAQFKVLYYINSCRNGANLKEIAQLMDVSPSNASRLVEKLVQKEWADRVVSPESKREIIVKITREGKRMLRKLAPEQRRVMQNYLHSRTSGDQLEKLNGLLQLIMKDEVVTEA
ncbi:MarR family transcriptional regulator [Chrysiogenes arsenatis]|uniref:MarR family transcriptional regulator n=1 Tax=Chrysiogenes arsenatis TaxID=309797 RepID=UPI000483D590|nr:MarR family transcriptional regulator [Chrysiogenes arsenatis]